MIGFRVLPRRRRIDYELVEKFRSLPVANVSDAMGRLAAFGPALRPYHGGGKVLAGPAVTVRTRPGDNLMVHKAIDLAEEGDVIIVDGGGDLTNALIGELMVAHAMTLGIAGFVLNGAVRDVGWISRNDFPIYAAGVTHRGPYKDGPGEINMPISIGGVVIAPGDLILGDQDGVVSIAIDEAEVVYEAARAKQEAETRQMQDIAAGRNQRGWVDATLRRLGCELP